MATIGELPDKSMAQNDSTAKEAETLTPSSHDPPGLTMRPLATDERQRMGIRITGGLLVQGGRGAAASTGIRQGDVIVGVKGHRLLHRSNWIG